MKCEKHGYDGDKGAYPLMNFACADCWCANVASQKGPCRRVVAENKALQDAAERLQANHVAALARKGAEIEALENDLAAATIDVTSAEMALAETERLQAENMRLKAEKADQNIGRQQAALFEQAESDRADEADRECGRLRAEMAQLRAAQSGSEHAREIRLMQDAHEAALAAFAASHAEIERLKADNLVLAEQAGMPGVWGQSVRDALRRAGLIYGDEVVQQVNGIEDSAKEAAQTASRLSRDIDLMRAACEYLVGLIKGAKPSREGE